MGENVGRRGQTVHNRNNINTEGGRRKWMYEQREVKTAWTTMGT
jgi:hypothetical protein